MFDWQKAAEAAWDTRADNWHKRSQRMWDHGSRQTIIPFIKEHMPHGDKIVDLGCGDGYGSYKLHEAGYQVTGVDISSEMIHLATQRFGDEPMTFLQGDLVDLPFADNRYDALMAINSLEWLESPLQGIQELYRIVKGGGLVCVGLLGPTAGPRNHSYERLYGEKTICNTMMPWEFERLANEQGFEVIAGQGVYKRGVNKHHYDHLPVELQQSLTFMWLFMLKKVGEAD